MDYQEVISYMYDMLPMYQRVGDVAFKKDLTNTRKLCRHLGHPEENFRSIHIAGTNGKGSSAHMLSAILTRSGYRTGLYTSPHLKHFSERIKIDGTPVNEQFIVDFVESMRPAIEKIKPSFFELTVAMAFAYFSREKVDFAVIEVGLGGRLDSTNVIHPEVALITNISYDHQDMLGDTLDKIAFEKAGIIKKRTPVIIGERDDQVSQVFDQVARKRKAPLLYATDRYSVQHVQAGREGMLMDVFDMENTSRRRLMIGTTDRTQVLNVPGVIAVSDMLMSKGVNIREQTLSDGLRSYQADTGLKGRWQVLRDRPLVLADVAHNKAGLENALTQLKGLDHDQIIFIVGFVKEKDIGTILPLFPKEARYIFCQAGVPRAMDAKWVGLQAALYDLDGIVIPDVNEALERALEMAGDSDIIFVGGSTFVVAELKDI